MNSETTLRTAAARMRADSQAGDYYRFERFVATWLESVADRLEGPALSYQDRQQAVVVARAYMRGRHADQTQWTAGALTPAAWCELLDARIVDPDGWRDGTRSWDEPIDRAEFDRRLLRCTIDMRGYPEFCGGGA